MVSGITTVNGSTIASNFTSGPGQTTFSNDFNAGTTVTSIFGLGAFSVGGSTIYPSVAAVTADNIQTTVSGASLISFNGLNDTVSAGGSAPYMSLLGNSSVLNEGSGPSTVIGGNGASTVNAGSGSTTVVGGYGSLTFTGGTSSNDSITAGSGMETLNAGTGGSNTLIGGSGGTFINLTGASTGDHIIGGTGSPPNPAVTIVNATTTTGNFEIDTNPNGGGTLVALLGGGADTVIGGGGSSIITAGSGPDVFGFVNGHAGGSEYILGFNAQDNMLFSGYTTPLTEQVTGGSDTITLGDGTTIVLLGIDHKVF